MAQRCYVVAHHFYFYLLTYYLLLYIVHTCVRATLSPRESSNTLVLSGMLQLHQEKCGTAAQYEHKKLHSTGMMCRIR